MSLSSQILSYFNKTFQLFQVLWADVVHQDPKALCHFWHGLFGVLGLHVLRGVLLHVLLLEQEWWNVQLCKLQHHRRHLLHLPLHRHLGNFNLIIFSRKDDILSLPQIDASWECSANINMFYIYFTC